MSPQQFETWLAPPPAGRRRPTLVMGVLNVTPDSFSDGNRYADPAAAVRHGLGMLADGADLLDVGGESTRPGSERTPAEEQVLRVVPVIEGLVRERPGCLISVDTTRAAVAGAALDAGAAVINDISAGTDDPGILALAGRWGCPLVLMHKRGEPATMQDNPVYADVVGEVLGHLRERLGAAAAAGVDPGRVLLDPGIGFGKTAAHSLELLRRLGEFRALGRPLLLGTSRKGFLGKIAGEPEARERAFSTAASVAWCVANGADVVRVHDVSAMAKVVRVIRAITDAPA